MYRDRSDLIEVNYTFEFENGQKTEFQVLIEPNTLTLVRTFKEPPPEWSKLENFQCNHCPLNREEYKYCPVAVNLKDVITFFSDTPSYEKVKVTVVTHERTYKKNTTVQDGVCSLLGILMASSGCPILGKLKPLVKSHLPFASIEETELRVFSSYLFAQYIRNKNGHTPDWKLDGLKKLYSDIQLINQNIAMKIADLESLDASINAVIVLNNFADTVTFSIDEDDLSYYKKLFSGWIE